MRTFCLASSLALGLLAASGGGASAICNCVCINGVSRSACSSPIDPPAICRLVCPSTVAPPSVQPLSVRPPGASAGPAGAADDAAGGGR